MKKNDLRIYKKIVDCLYDAIMVTDKSGVIIIANQPTADSFHLPLSEVIGKTPRQLMDAGVYQNSPASKALETKQVVEEIIILPDSQRFSTSVPILDEDGNVELVITSSRADKVLNEFSRQLAYEQKQNAIYQNIALYLSGVRDNEFIYKSDQMGKIISTCSAVATTDSAVMISGESGVGKELVAQSIHRMSPRRDKAFIPVNCSAIASELFESEFFGYKGGAFTGATSKGKIGLLQMAHGGTLFLDELGDLPLLMQSKLLRFLASGEIYPVGSNRPEYMDVRIISATNRDLLQMVQAKTFREDLFYRLNAFPVHIPPLRERQEDIDVLVVFYLNMFNKKHNKNIIFHDRDLALLRQYPWPGNVRELRNAIERVVILGQGSFTGQALQAFLSPNTIPRTQVQCTSQGAFCTATISLEHSLAQALEQFEKMYIETVVERHQGRLQDAAQTLNVHRTTLYRKRKDAQ